MTELDVTGLHNRENLTDRLRRANKTLILYGVREQPSRLLYQAAFLNHVVKENILPSTGAALQRACEVRDGVKGPEKERYRGDG